MDELKLCKARVDFRSMTPAIENACLVAEEFGPEAAAEFWREFDKAAYGWFTEKSIHRAVDIAVKGIDKITQIAQNLIQDEALNA